MEAFKMDTAYIMAQYNFNKPLTVEVIYDDNEETIEEVITQDKRVHYDRRLSDNIPSSVELSSGEQTQARISVQLKRSVENDMLNEVIGYMSVIVETNYKFSQVFKKLSTTDAADFKLKYLDMKYLFFKKSLTVATLLLLPQKNNESFIRNIVIKILNKGNLNGNLYKNARLLYADLLAWAESQLDKDKKDAGAQKRLRLLNTAQPNHTVPHLNSKSHADHRERRLSPHDIIGVINESSEMLRNNSVVNVESFPIPNHNDNSIIEQSHISQVRTSCHLEMTSPDQNIYPFVINTAPSNKVYYPSISATYYNAPNTYLSESNYLNHVLNMQDTQHPFGAHSAIGYQGKVQTLISGNLLDNNLSHLEKNSDDGRDISRSSISRDSGFMSPDISISPRESTITNNQDLSPTWQNSATHDAPNLTPNISSTNKIVVGACHVCGTQTELLCLGCFQYFYCSKNCQTTHWRLHKSMCGTSVRS